MLCRIEDIQFVVCSGKYVLLDLELRMTYLFIACLFVRRCLLFDVALFHMSGLFSRYYYANLIIRAAPRTGHGEES